MSAITKYLAISDKLLLEYQANKSLELAESNFIPLSYHNPFVIEDLQGTIMFLDGPYKEDVKKEYKSDLHFQSFPDKYGTDWFYPGFNDYVQEDSSALVHSMQNYSLIASIKGGPFSTGELPYDTVRIHILTGYVFDDVDGFVIRTKADQRKYNTSSDSSVKDITSSQAVISAFTFKKENMGKVVEFDPSPIYMSGKFYDRYIEFKIPSIYNLAINNPNKNSSLSSDVANSAGSDVSINSTLYGLLDLSQDSDITFEFSNIEKDVFTLDSIINSGENEGKYPLSSVLKASIPFSSNADYFNVVLMENSSLNALKYGAVWGASDSKYISYINNSIMNNIESGAIPMYNLGFKDENEGWEEFSSIYGTDARHWVIVHELYLVYKYYLLESSQTDDYIEREERYSFTEGFSSTTGGQETNGGYSYNFKPSVSHLSGYECKTINVTYTAKLMNRMNGATIVRTGTMSLSNAESKYGENAYSIDVDNIITWKIFNQSTISSPVIDSSARVSETKYVKQFYDATSVQMKNASDGSYSSAGSASISLYQSTHNYLFQFIIKDASTGAVKYLDLSGPYVYILRAKDRDGNNLDFSMVQDTAINKVLGQIEFQISEEAAQKMLLVDAGSRYFSILVKNTDGSYSSMFQGTYTSL